jgi:hypothetical protein
MRPYGERSHGATAKHTAIFKAGVLRGMALPFLCADLFMRITHPAAPAPLLNSQSANPSHDPTPLHRTSASSRQQATPPSARC